MYPFPLHRDRLREDMDLQASLLDRSGMIKPERFWDRLAKGSGRIPATPSGSSRLIVEAAQRHLTSESVVLDFGCGLGDITLEMAKRAKRVHGIDTSPGAIEVAKAKALHCGRANASFSCDSLFHAGLSERSFTVVTAFNVLLYLGDTAAGVRRIANLLGADGVFLSSTACLGVRRTALGPIVSLLSRVRLIPSIQRFKSSELKSLIESGGFQIIETAAISKLPELFIAARKTA